MAVSGLVCAVLLLVALAMLFVGWRGRRFGDHPHCRRCEFDLFGQGHDATTCPECGADVRHHPPRTGQRRRRPVLVVLGLLALLIGGTIGGGQIWANASKDSFYAAVPDYYLLWVIDDLDARTELATRLPGGNVRPWVAQSAVDRALSVQADRSKPWEESWGTLIESAWAAKLLSQDQIERYAKQSVGDVVIKARPRVQRGRTPRAYLSVDTDDRRMGPHTEIVTAVQVRDLSIAGETMKVGQYLRTGTLEQKMTQTGWSRRSSHLLRDPPPSMLGPMTIEVGGDVETTAVLKAQGIAVTLPPEKLQVQATIEVVDELTGTYITDSIPLEERASTASAWFEQEKDGKWLLNVLLAGTPEPVDPNAWIETDGQWISPGNNHGTTTSTRDGKPWRQTSWQLSENVVRALEEEGEVNLLVRPDFADAEEATEIKPTWLGEWRFQSVPFVATASGRRWDDPPPEAARATAHLLTTEQAHQDPTDQPTLP